MARSSECTEQYAQKVLDRDPHCQRRDVTPTIHLFGHTFDHDYYFELPREEERDTQSITRCSTAHHQDVQVVPRANRTFSTARNPIPSASSNTNAPPAFAPSPPWRFSALAAALGGNTYSAIPADSAPSLAPLPLKGSATVSCLVS